MAISERLQQRIAALRVKYVKSFADEIDGFQRELGQVHEEGSLLIRQRAHRIAGTAGSYQLDAVWKAAQAVEEMCVQDAESDEIHSAVVRLCEELRSAS